VNNRVDQTRDEKGAEGKVRWKDEETTAESLAVLLRVFTVVTRNVEQTCTAEQAVTDDHPV